MYPLNNGEVSTYTLYEDAGDTRAYQTGEAARTTITATQSGGETTIEISPAHGHYAGMPASRSYEIRLPNDWPAETVTIKRLEAPVVDNGRTKFRFEGNTLTTVIDVGRTPVTGKVTVRVIRSEKLLAQRGELNGFPGAMTRLRSAIDTLQHAWPFSRVPDDLAEAAQTGDRIGYYPQTAEKELGQFRELLLKTQAQVEVLAKSGVSDQEKRKFAEALGPMWDTPEAQQALADHPKKMARALAVVNDAVASAATSH